MPAGTPHLVLIAHHAAPVRRILRLNCEAEQIGVSEAASVQECLDALRRGRIGAVVLHPQLLEGAAEGPALSALLRQIGVPVLVLSERPEHRRVAAALGGAPFCNRPDDPERVTAAVRGLLSGAGLPALV